ncbi:MAG: ABC transporter ATP-binding protein [Lachnospiraceae bacterium]|nr:ABC transporter ATP-binding protein [Lachnospiraceae bacterium]
MCDDMKVEFKNVTGTGNGFRLCDINMEIREGYLTGLVGKNGAGKTTLFRYLVDLAIKFQGDILIDERAGALSDPSVRSRIAYVSEDQQFVMEKTAEQNAQLYGMLYERFDLQQFKENMRRLAVSTRKCPGQMSRGEYLRFQMAFAMAHDTKLYLLDEVTAGMDPVFRKDFFRLLHEILLQEDVAILMSSHIEEEVGVHMDYVVTLDEGRLVSVRETVCKQSGRSEDNGTCESF